MNKVMVVLSVVGLAACSGPQPTQYTHSLYQCGDRELSVTEDSQADTVQFELDGIWYKLLRVESKEGRKYAFGLTSFWQHGDQTIVANNNTTLLTCHSGKST
ncbi:MliC family protein [Aeromonas simiae]|uniref:MliC family protein n=1 Tax=Aeromonas simiae TaxID=218936 RepID=UPI0005A632E6|nr:MliC family protein [Aeromonas simiae]